MSEETKVHLYGLKGGASVVACKETGYETQTVCSKVKIALSSGTGLFG